MAENRVIGRDNTLPWQLPADLKHFRRITMGHTIIMGRKSYQSIGRPLPGRTNVVVTRVRDFVAPGCIVAHSVEEALEAARTDAEPFVIGGAELYAQTLAKAQRLYITLVHAEISGEIRFPMLQWDEWRELSRDRHNPDAQHAHPYSFVTLERAT